MLDRKLLAPGSPYTGTKKPRKELSYTFGVEGGQARFKVHLGGFPPDAWAPIYVGFQLESQSTKNQWRERVAAAMKAGSLPENTEHQPDWATFAEVKAIDWTTPKDLTPDLAEQVATTLLQFEAALGPRRRSR